MYKEIFSIQYLRAIAAIIVVIAHSQVHIHVRGYLVKQSDLLHFGTAGVDVFFIISGFIMIYISYDSFGKQGVIKDFIIRRFIRIAPTYWFYTVIIAGLLLGFPMMFSEGKMFDLFHFIASMTFVPYENNIGYPRPVLFVGWTLNYEMYFYYVFALLLAFNSKYFFKLISTLFIVCVAIGLSYKMTNPIYLQVTSPLLLEFLLGCYIGILIKKDKVLPVSASYILLMVAIVGYILSLTPDGEQLHRSLRWGLPSALLVYSVVSLELKKKIKCRNPYILAIGDSSYSLYLTHIFSINLIGFVWYRYINLGNSLFIGVASVVSIIAAYIAFLIIEKPITDRLRVLYKTNK